MSTQTIPYNFNKITNSDHLNILKIEWEKSLLAAQDDMWEAFINYAQYWEIQFKGEQIGYACVNNENCLLQFYVAPFWLHDAVSILQQFIQQEEIKNAMIGTNNPICLSAAMHLQTSVTVHTYLFNHMISTTQVEKDGKVKLAKKEDLDDIVDFCYQSMGAPKEWLTGYVSNLIDRGEFFLFENEKEIMGSFEVRKSDSSIHVANIGMVVAPGYRKKGLGTYLLGQSTKKALEWNKQPICSCEKDNIGSLKAIHNNGFRSLHQMLKFDF